jgi:Protein of unknown function (DUF1488)
MVPSVFGAGHQDMRVLIRYPSRPAQCRIAPMPLTMTDLPGVADSEWQAIGVWMADDQGKPVWLLITYEALHEIDSHVRPQDLPAVLQIFHENRKKITALASRKFDRKGVNESRYEEQPVLVVQSHDL